MDTTIFVDGFAAGKRVDDGPHRGTVTDGRPPHLRSTVAVFVSPLSVVSLAIVALTLGTARESASADANVEEWPLPDLPEPSGIAYHPLRKSLFVVGDEGDIAEVSTEGKLLRVRHIGGDLEGVTSNPADGKVYVVREGVDVILEIDVDDLKIAREIPVSRTYDGDTNYIHAGGDGIEGITFRPTPSPGSAPDVFAVNQYDPPVLLELALPAAGAAPGTAATIRNAWPLKSPPISDVSWDATVDGFVVVSALWRNASVVSPAGAELRSIRIPGIMQEGIARLPDGTFVIVQDTGGLLKWKPPSDPFVAQDQAGVDASRGNPVKSSDP